MFIYSERASALYEVNKHFDTSWNSETFLSLFWLSAALQPARTLLNTAVNNEQQKGNSGGSVKTLTLSIWKAKPRMPLIFWQIIVPGEPKCQSTFLVKQLLVIKINKNLILGGEAVPPVSMCMCCGVLAGRRAAIAGTDTGMTHGQSWPWPCSPMSMPTMLSRAARSAWEWVM